MQKRFRWISLFGLMVAAIIISTFSVQATQTDTVSVRCNLAQVTGQSDTTAPYMRIQVALASDLSQILATKVVNVHRNGTYNGSLNYERQAENTLLIVSIGEWDGQNYLNPAAMVGYYCNQNGGSSSAGPTPPPTPMPSEAPSYYIAYFSGDQYYIAAGGCVTLSYWVVGAESITLQASNSSAEPELILDNPNQRIVCPSAADGYVPGEPVTYTLNVVYLNGLQDSAYVSVQEYSDNYPTPVPTPQG
jgi:hypothetical protein